MQNEVWTAEGCGYCILAKKLLDEYNFKYVEINARDNKEAFKEKFPDATTVPQIIFHGQKVGGYTDLVEEFHNQNIFIGSQSLG